MAIALWDDKPTQEKAQGAAGYLTRTLEQYPTDHMTMMYLPQMETAEECAGCMAGATWVAINTAIWVAVLTNLFNERTNSEIAPTLAALGIAALAEVYPAENTAWYDKPIDYENAMIADCKRLGYEFVVLLLGVYWEYALSRFQPQDLPGSWNYLGETMTDRQGDWDVYFSST
jgi:hypothetical protein